MENIIEYRNDVPPANDYPQRIVSPTAASACCTDHMERIGRHAIDARWRYYYKRCTVCGYSVRHFYAPSLVSVLEAAKQIKLALAEMNLGTGKRKRRTQAEIDREIAAALGLPLKSRPVPARARRALLTLGRRRPAPSSA